MNEWLVRQVWRRAKNACEYCRIPQIYYPSPFEIDHIVARQHDGPTKFDNLALACLHCNAHKGPNLSGLDPRTRQLTRLFHPRRHKWQRHFRWHGALLVGRTAIGRTTIRVLAINGWFPLNLREELLREGLFPVRD